MTEKSNGTAQAKGGVCILCFLVVIIGQIYLLRNVLFGGGLSSMPATFYIEFIFWLFLIAGIVLMFIKKDGWGGMKGRAVVFAIFIVYAIYSILTYKTFQEAYLTGFNPEFASAGSAIVGLKLVLTIVGITAGIPVAPKIDDLEYAHRLREKVYERDAEMAKASVKGAKRDLEDTVEKLKNSLSKEELAALMSELQLAVDTQPGDESAVSDISKENAPEEAATVSEQYPGWGGGM